MIEQLPRWLVVSVVLIGASFLIIFINPPHTACDAQIEVVKERLKGRLFPGKGVKTPLPPAYIAQMETCKFSNSPGGCYELFFTMRLVARELLNLDFTCNEAMGSIGEVRSSITSVIQLLAEIAWGEQPPNPGEMGRAWLEPTDLGLYCHLKDLYVRYNGPESFESFMDNVLKGLPGEAPVFEAGACVNCEFRKKALDVMSREEVWAKSIFAVRCDSYR